MLTSKVQLGYVLIRGWGASCPGRFILPPAQIFRREWIIPKFLLHHLLQEYLVDNLYKHYFNQSEMLTSKVQLGYVLIRGGGQAVQGGLSCPPPRISKRMDNQQFLLHHLLQKYLVITDINFISVNLRWSLQRFSSVTYWQGVGGKLSRAVYHAPRPEFQRELIIPKFYYTICYRNI